MDLSRYRSEFPVVDRLLFLNHASESPVSRPVRRRIHEYLDAAENDPDAAPVSLARVRELLAQLLGGRADEYAIMPNTATGLGTVAGGLPWQGGENVVVPDEEYPANAYPWLNLRERGVEVRVVPLRDGRVDPADVAALVDARTRVVAVSAVEYLSGFRNDLPTISAIARAAGALFVVDGIQAAGAVPLNVTDDGIDVLAAGGYKWLLGPVGTGFVYVREALWERIRPVLPGSRSSVKGPEDKHGEFELLGTAQRYETGCLPLSLHHGWTAGLEMLLEAGVEQQIHPHLLTLTDRLIDGLRTRGFRVTSPVERVSERSGIVSFTTGAADRNEALVQSLHRQGIVIALRDGRCRVSPHFYNTAADIDRVLEALPAI